MRLSESSVQVADVDWPQVGPTKHSLNYQVCFAWQHLTLSALDMILGFSFIAGDYIGYLNGRLILRLLSSLTCIHTWIAHHGLF